MTKCSWVLHINRYWQSGDKQQGESVTTHVGQSQVHFSLEFALFFFLAIFHRVAVLLFRHVCSSQYVVARESLQTNDGAYYFPINSTPLLSSLVRVRSLFKCLNTNGEGVAG